MKNHKQEYFKEKLLKDFEYLNLPKEIKEKIENPDLNVYESYLMIKDFLDYITKK